ncbi:helix-turn-helix domain-containing protein [[Clostridium] dakarense]|uniref:helix-turn-helix domain-containing protein n=1 Tax=Faecalimicrobium dakarense TaxID=1301100 RepID=UPI0005A9C796|nr:XRE family transcriptional regulator [[Clostridium] dakarense]
MLTIKNIGEKVKQLRNAKGLTLKELGEKTNLSSGFLSQFERGMTTIAIDSLEDIASIFGVDLSFFFEKSVKNDSIVIRSYEQNNIQILNSHHIYKVLATDIENKSFLPRLIEILPNKQEEKISTFNHAGEEFLYILEGVLDLVLDDKEYCLYPGDSIYYSSNKNHNWLNKTNKTVKFLSINYPKNIKKD